MSKAKELLKKYGYNFDEIRDPRLLVLKGLECVLKEMERGGGWTPAACGLTLESERAEDDGFVYLSVKSRLKLEPCPFCGSEEIVILSITPVAYQYGCIDCGAIAQSGSTRTEARNLWNQRRGE